MTSLMLHLDGDMFASVLIIKTPCRSLISVDSVCVNDLQYLMTVIITEREKEYM